MAEERTTAGTVVFLIIACILMIAIACWIYYLITGSNIWDGLVFRIPTRGETFNSIPTPRF